MITYIFRILVLTIAFSFCATSSFAATTATKGLSLKGEWMGPQVTTSPWTLSKKDKNAVYFTLTNAGGEKVSGSYRLVITPVYVDKLDAKPIYDKTTKVKNLKPGKDKKVSVYLNKNPLLKKLDEGHYNAELYTDEKFIGSEMFAVSKASSQTATIKVSTPYDGTYLPVGGTLPIYADISGDLPKGGHIQFMVITRDQGGMDWTRTVGEQSIEKDFPGRVTFSVPYYGTYAGRQYSNYKSGNMHFTAARLYAGSSMQGVQISESSGPWFYTTY